MLYCTGIAISQESAADFIVAAATWHSSLPPNFSTQQMTLPYARENMSALVIVRNDTLDDTVNAACHRTVEQLLIKTRFKVAQPPTVRLIIRPIHAVHRYALPSTKKRHHWLLTTADSALFDWLRGVR